MPGCISTTDSWAGRVTSTDGRAISFGSRQLSARTPLDGHQTVAIGVVAEAGCRFIKHRLQREPGTKKSRRRTTGRESPSTGCLRHSILRLRGPRRGHQEARTRLRPDLDRADSISGGKRPIGAALKLRVSPDSASIGIDGAVAGHRPGVAADGGAAAVSTGSHRIEVSAPGYERFSETIELEDGEVLELSVELTESTARP